MNSNKQKTKFDGRLPKNLIYPPIYLQPDDLFTFQAGIQYRRVLRKIESGQFVLPEGSFATALSFYSWLKKHVSARFPVTGYISSRKNREEFSRLAGKILVKINDHNADLEKAPVNQWLKEFYPDNKLFFIALPDFLGMNGSRQWFEKGIRYPGLERSIHPFYGVYFPTRTEHISLFQNWLKNNAHNFTSAVDIGTGCGILAVIMAKYGIARIKATDINPNAVFSAQLEASRHGYNKVIKTENGSFFGSGGDSSGLVVINPPWIPGDPVNMTDKGVYYKQGFFETFFSEAGSKMEDGSTLVILFSSFAKDAGLTSYNPVEHALERSGKFFVKEKLSGKVSERSSKTSKSWLNMIREKETTELWVLEKVCR